MPATAEVIQLRGDPKNPEPAEYIIEFPGGAISVTRTTDNEYWAHISVNKEKPVIDKGRESMIGEIVHTRCDYEFPLDIMQIPMMDKLVHIAIRIKTHK